jgi:hypothetical protein
MARARGGDGTFRHILAHRDQFVPRGASIRRPRLSVLAKTGIHSRTRIPVFAEYRSDAGVGQKGC